MVELVGEFFLEKNRKDYTERLKDGKPHLVFFALLSSQLHSMELSGSVIKSLPQ